MKNIKDYIEEFFMGIIGFLGTTINSKMSLGVFLLVLGLAFIWSPTNNFSEKEQVILRILGFVFLIFSVLLFFFRFKELNKH